MPRSGSEQHGRRPVVVISNDGFNEVPTWRSVIVIPLTTSSSQALRGPTVVAVASTQSGLHHASYAICHQITTLDRAKLNERIGTLTQEELHDLESGVLAACDIAP
jgi:mRNA-degrading endonuclease toxin of MazEF toxin-antitoxin module